MEVRAPVPARGKLKLSENVLFFLFFFRGSAISRSHDPSERPSFARTCNKVLKGVKREIWVFKNKSFWNVQYFYNQSVLGRVDSSGKRGFYMTFTVQISGNCRFSVSHTGAFTCFNVWSASCLTLWCQSAIKRVSIKENWPLRHFLILHPVSCTQRHCGLEAFFLGCRKKNSDSALVFTHTLLLICCRTTMLALFWDSIWTLKLHQMFETRVSGYFGRINVASLPKIDH